MKTLINKAINIAYYLLGPERSSLLATGWLGGLYLKSRYGDINKIRVFQSDEGPKLKLTPYEASLLGLIYFGRINPLETELLKKVLRSGDVFIDVGAYIDGWHSLLASGLVGDKGKVYTFEPHPKYFDRLNQNLKLNNIKNIRLEKMAVADENGKRQLFPAENISSFFEKHAKVLNEKTRPFKVKTATLDSYIQKQKIKNIKLIKIDVECAEMLVLKGARKMLSKKYAPDLLIEVVNGYLKIAGSSEKELVSFLRKYSYTPYIIESSGLIKYKKTSLESRSLNLYFSKSKKTISF